MRGSLAIWCDSADAEVHGYHPKIELHFNMWRDLPGGKQALDIGILFKEARPIRRLHVYIPADVPMNAVEDLSSTLQDSETLSAVFNDLLEVGERSSNTYEVMRGQKVILRIVRIDAATHLRFETLTEPDGSKGTVITFEESFLSLMREVGDHYTRLRIPLQGDIAKLFNDEFIPRDRIFLSGFYKTDVVEFRVNERRNFGAALRARYPNMVMPTILTLQYFLVVDIGTELVRSHAAFRKMRRLEPALWTRYLEAFGSVKPDQMVIYHWRAGGEPGKNVDDFIAFASFRAAKLNIRPYLFAILLLGAGGSALQSLGTKALGSLGLGEDCWLIQAILIGLILGALGGVYLWAAGGRVGVFRNGRSIFKPNAKV